jgi:hypothetical protein
MLKLILSSVFLITLCASSYGQYYYDRSKNPEKIEVPKTGRDFDTFFFFSWDLNRPMSNPDFISQSSTLGTKLGFRKRLNDVDKLWVGAEFGWAVYKQHFPYQTIPLSNNSSLSTDWYNYAYSYSLAASIDYFFLPMERIVTPYAGLGIGVAYDKFSQFYNIYGQSANSWGLMLRPEAGILIGFKPNSSWRLQGAVHYDYSSNATSTFGYKGFTNVGYQIGIVKMAW